MQQLTSNSWYFQPNRKAHPNQTVIDISEDLKWLRGEDKNVKEKTVITLPSKKEKCCNDYNYIPNEMKQHKCWVCWSKEERNGKLTKVPKNPKTGGNASTSLSCTWGTFTQAEGYYKDHPDTIEGIGYVFTENGGVVGIDIDHCVESGEIINEEIKTLVDRCGSYVELSPSGTGIHMYVKGKWKEPGGRKNNNLGSGMAIEVYPAARFFTVTGNAFGEVRQLAENQELLDEIYDRYFAVKEDSSAMTPVKLDALDVAPEYIKRLQERLENSRGWLALLWQGQHTKESESEADMALLCRLLVICDGEEDSARKLFMASPFAQHKDADHRKKLEREDYWRMSIDNAIEYLELHPEFDRYDRFRPLLRYDGDNDGHASMLFDYMDGNILYCPEENEWAVCENGCWNRDPDAHIVRSKLIDMNKDLKDTVDAIIAEKMDTMDEDEIKKAKARLKKKIGNLGNSYGIDGTIRYAKDWRGISVSESQLDSHDDLLAVGNGIINLHTGELIPFDRQLYITRQTEINYNPDAPEPKRFLQFLREIFAGYEEIIPYLQLCLGYCLTGCTEQEAFFVMHGKTGQNGKSTLFNKVLLRMFPQHIKTLSPGALQKKKDLDGHNSSLVQSKNFRMVIANENAEDFHMDEQMVRSISSGESPNARDLYKGVDSYKPHFKIVFCCNFVPKFNWRYEHNRRRLCLIPFRVHITEEKRDNDLDKKLWQEREGILKWLVEGAMRSFKEDLKKQKPQCVIDYTEAMFREDDPVYAFTQDELIPTEYPGDTIQAQPLFEAYNNWRQFNDLPREDNQTKFGRRLKELGYLKGRDARNNVVYTNVILRQECHSECEEADNPEQ